MLEVRRQPFTSSQREQLEARISGPVRRAFARLLWGKIHEDFERRLREDLERGMAERLELRLERLATGEELRAEGPFLFGDAGDGHVVCLAGQWLLDPHVVVEEPPEAEDEWFRAFSLVRAPASGVVLELRATSKETLKAERRLAASATPFFSESAVVSASLDTLERVLATMQVSPAGKA